MTVSSNPGGDPLHQGGAQMTMSGSMSSTLVSFSKDFTTPCVMGATCDLKCEYGYVNGPMNSCQYCICATPGSKLNTKLSTAAFSCYNAGSELFEVEM